MSKNIFVFVVCGAAEHIDTLHLSLKYLEKYSRNEIFIITDSSRNEIELKHAHIIDIKTDEQLNHHQASIYLKTGIHKFLPRGNNYCYLDTDVLALSDECDAIFNEFIAPIRFAPDHCRVRKFSAYAVNCGCLKKREADREIFGQFVDTLNGVTITDPLLLAKGKELQFVFDQLKQSPLKRLTTALRYFLSYPVFKLNDTFSFNKKTRSWSLPSGGIVMHEMNIKKMQEATGLRYNKWNQKWYNKDNEDIWHDECNHLVAFIKNTFQVDVTEKDWQHWNGGVFLFNDASHDFLDAWHNKTMHIFTLPAWKTRDQGTLIATAWEFGLSAHPVLSKKWNFIADYYNNGLELSAADNLVTDDGFKTAYHPVFVHVYHNWGKADWELWQWIQSKLN
ncbi:MAG: hypothetical protein V4658_08155 [Bacteroidota bacterium]